MSMLECDSDTSVPDWIVEYPETLVFFEELSIDTSCGGKSLAFACQQQGLDLSFVLARLHRFIAE